jgi:hypothetical protein
VLGLLLVPIAQHPALASSEEYHLSGSPAVNLRLDRTGATRVMADLSGGAQESDTEKPKSMEAQASTEPAAGTASAVKKEAPPPDQFAFLKDWPFWVIVGGVVIAGAATYMLLSNSNEQGPCAPKFSGGCFGER